MRLLILSLFLVACAHRPPRSATPDLGNGLTAKEYETCSHLECQTFMAPCDLLGVPTRQTSLLEDQYRERVAAYERIGYCLREPRHLPAPDYAKGTCFFLLVRGEVCKKG